MQTIIQTPTNKLADSLDFYAKLDFKMLASEGRHIVSDGKVIIEVNPDRFARAGVKLYQTSWSETVQELKKIVEVISIDNGYLLSDPSGAWIYLLESKDDSKYDLSQINPSKLGNFAGVSLETIDMGKSLQIWQLLGFTKTAGALEQGWVTLANSDGMAVSLMLPLNCPHLFFNPSLTYFNGADNLRVIQEVRDAQIPITEEVTYFNKEGLVDNIIIRDPGGLGFFIFND